MEPYEEKHLNENEHGNSQMHLGSSPWLALVAIVLLVIAGFSMAYGFHEQSQVNQLKDQAALANNSMNQLQTQVGTLTAKLNDMVAAQTAAASTNQASRDSSNGAATSTKAASAKRSTAKQRAAADKRYAQLKNQLEDQQKQLKETQDEVAKNRADLEGSINSTRDDLNGSIARTHEELVALEKRGERNFFEFDLSKSKQFQRFGPLTLSLRKADTKHKNYDLAMIVDDNELTKKRVNLYEPIWIHTENGGQPIQVVVNHIGKNVIHGYVSAPKYKTSELSALSSSVTTPAPTLTPTPQTAPAPDSNSSQPTSPVQQ